MNEHLKSAHEHTAMAKVAQMKDDAAEYGQQMTRAFEEMALYAQDLLADNDMLKAKLAEHGID